MAKKSSKIKLYMLLGTSLVAMTWGASAAFRTDDMPMNTQTVEERISLSPDKIAELSQSGDTEENSKEEKEPEIDQALMLFEAETPDDNQTEQAQQTKESAEPQIKSITDKDSDQENKEEAKAEPKQRTEHLPLINTQEEWDKLAHQPNSHVSARTEIVKFVFDRGEEKAEDWKLYLTNTNLWKTHYYFVRDRITQEQTHQEFNDTQYREDDRRFVMGSLVHYIDSDLWTLEVIPGDTMSIDMLKKAFLNIQDKVFFGNDLRFHPQSGLQEEYARTISADVYPIFDNEFRGLVRYQPLTLGHAEGVLRIVEGELDPATVKPNEILVTENVPDDLPVCAGLITSKLQAPLAHISLLLGNRKTPNMALRGATDLKTFQDLDGKTVALNIRAQDFDVKEIDEQTQKTARPETSIKASQDFSKTEIVNICDGRLSDVASIGGKAAYLGELCRIKPSIETPSGFVIPLTHYAQHAEKLNLFSLLEARKELGSIEVDEDSLADKLKAMRTAILEQELPKDLVARVKRYVTKQGAKKFIFRSSSNVEDVQGFSGAGLYSSKVIDGEASDTEIEEAIKHVWASLWNLRAYQEREWYRIDHKHVGMAVLVQPFVEDLKANGVAITANPYTHTRPGFLINVQTMDAQVTGEHDGNAPESLLVYTYAKDLETHVLSRSNLNDYAPILNENEIEALMHELKKIHARFITQKQSKKGAAMDIEFLVKNDGTIVVVQARPYHVTFKDKADKENTQ